MTALRALLFNLAFFSWTSLVCLIRLPPALTIFDAKDVHAVLRLWARGTFALLQTLCGIDYRIRGREFLPPSPCIIAAKHQSAWDTMIFSLLFDQPCYVLKRELTLIPLFGWGIRRSGMVAVNRSGGPKALKQMVADAQQRLREGRHIVIFPEGTRTAPGQRRPYHPGVAAIYRELGVPVVPVALNSGLFWGRRSFMKYPGRILMEFLRPIAPGLERRAFMKSLEQSIEGASQRLLEESTPGGRPNSACG
jgi:1-acyl-sn-glycerol-3-phosphate acyltransferase